MEKAFIGHIPCAIHIYLQIFSHDSEENIQNECFYSQIAIEETGETEEFAQDRPVYLFYIYHIYRLSETGPSRIKKKTETRSLILRASQEPTGEKADNCNKIW